MSRWRCTEFYGIVPSVRPKNLPLGYASVAHDVDLSHGSLRPFLEQRYIKDVGKDMIHLHSWGCELLTWDTCVSVAEWLPDCPRLFITGRNDYPETMTLEKCKQVYRRLGVPRPEGVIVAQATNKDTDKSRAVAYVITYVNNFGEEGTCSLPSNDVVIEDGDPVDLTFSLQLPDIEYDIKKLRIYRRETGFRTGLEKEQEFLTHWFFVKELNVNIRAFTDTVKIIDLGHAFAGIDTREPPKELSNITAIESTGILAGSVGNKLLFSKNLEPHNWLLSQELTLDDNIVALGSFGSSLFVATDGYPYKVQADVGCDDMECRQVVKYYQSLPMINCHVGHGSLVTPYGFIYASPDGLVLLGDGAPKVITSDVLSQDDWRRLEPQTARLAYHKGALFVRTDKISFILWLDHSTYSDTKYKKMVTISDEPVDFVETRQGELVFMQYDKDRDVNALSQWNAGNKWRPYRWVSGDVITRYYLDFTRGYASCVNGAVDVRILSERGELKRTFVSDKDVIPFGRLGRSKHFAFEACGVGEVTELVFGVSNVEMMGR